MARPAEWDLRKLQMSLEKGTPGPIYLLHGEETFLIDQAILAIRTKTLASGLADFNCDVLTAPETTPGQVRDIVETLPMMAERRLVIYRGIESVKDEAWEQLLPVVENPISSTVLVLVADKLDKRKKFIKRLNEVAILVDLKKPYENQIASWIEYIAFLEDLKLAPDAMAAIQQIVGTNLSEIQNEIRKIKQFLGPDAKSVALADVLKVVSKARVESVFSLTDAIGRRDRARALLCLANLLEHGQNEIGVLSLIYRQIRILSAVYDGKKAGLSGVRLSQKVGVPEFFLKQYLEQVRLWDSQKFACTIKALHETDKALKSSPVASHIWLENFVVQIC